VKKSLSLCACVVVLYWCDYHFVCFEVKYFLKRLMTDFYQSTCLEFRDGDVKVLGSQPHLTCGPISTYCVPYPNSIKRPFNWFILYAHMP